MIFPLRRRAIVQVVAMQYDVPLPSNDECEIILWEDTAFPLSGWPSTVAQLREVFENEAASAER